MTRPAEPFAPRTSLGDASLVFAMVGVLTCGLLSPLALVISVAALRHPPRRRAWGALCLSVAGIAVLLYALAKLASTPASE